MNLFKERCILYITKFLFSTYIYSYLILIYFNVYIIITLQLQTADNYNMLVL